MDAGVPGTKASHVVSQSSDMTPTHQAISTLSAVRTAKRALRKSMAQQLASLTREDIAAQSHTVSDRVTSSPTFQEAQKISIYVSMDSGEVDTDWLCRETLKQGKRLYVPLFASSAAANATATALPPADSPSKEAVAFAKDMRMLRINDVRDYESMKRNRWGIREPLDTTEDGVAREDALEEGTGGQGLDLILAPGVAFDQSGGRLGHGKGYYDRYLSRAEEWARARGSGSGPVCVALGLSQQLLPNGELVPADGNDRVLDAIVTPQGTLRGATHAQRWQDGK
ncbi:unnamed protein product [Parajaminaea phylloscopi]